MAFNQVCRVNTNLSFCGETLGVRLNDGCKRKERRVDIQIIHKMNFLILEDI